MRRVRVNSQRALDGRDQVKGRADDDQGTREGPDGHACHGGHVAVRSPCDTPGLIGTRGPCLRGECYDWRFRPEGQ